MTIVFISDDAQALACGADAVAAAFEKVGCTVERVSSWGMFWLEPLVEIGGLGYGPVRVEDVEGILTRHAELVSASTPHPSSSATIEAWTLERQSPTVKQVQGDDLCVGSLEHHPFIARQQRHSFARAGKTRPLSLVDYTATGGWTGLDRARSMAPADVVAEVTASGCADAAGRGSRRGSSGRPSPKPRAPRKYIVCNADEGDSGTFADRMLMEGDPFQLIEGMAIAAHAVGAGEGYIYVRSEYPHAIAKLNAAITLAAERLAPFRCRGPRRGRGLCVRRRNLAPQQHRGQARRSARQAAAPRAGRAVRLPDRGQQCADARRHPAHHGRRRGEPMPNSASTVPRARCRSSWRATSSMAGCSKPRSASPE
jgi:formate dehydrogenase iron-sulfur subunit